MLIHGFWFVNARLLMAFGTAFYAIIILFIEMPSDKQIEELTDRNMNGQTTSNLFLKHITPMRRQDPLLRASYTLFPRHRPFSYLS